MYQLLFSRWKNARGRRKSEENRASHRWSLLVRFMRRHVRIPGAGRAALERRHRELQQRLLPIQRCALVPMHNRHRNDVRYLGLYGHNERNQDSLEHKHNVLLGYRFVPVSVRANRVRP